MRILSQSGKEIFNLENCSLFVREETIYISDKVDLYNGRAAILGKYNTPEEAQDILLAILSRQGNYYIMPNKEENNEF